MFHKLQGYFLHFCVCVFTGISLNAPKHFLNALGRDHLAANLCVGAICSRSWQQSAGSLIAPSRASTRRRFNMMKSQSSTCALRAGRSFLEGERKQVTSAVQDA